MTNMQLRILKCLAKCPQGKTLNELEQISQACDPIDFAITLDAMVENNWIYKKNQDDKYFRITGIGEAALGLNERFGIHILCLLHQSF